MNPFTNPKCWRARYINLNHRKDRCRWIEAELSSVDIKGERFSALTDDAVCPALPLGQWNQIPNPFHRQFWPRVPGAWGVTFSHLTLMQEHVDQKDKRILLILEDDAHFCSDFCVRLPRLAEEFSDRAWDMIFLCATVRPENARPISLSLWRILREMWLSHAVLVNPCSIPRLMNMMSAKAPEASTIDALYSLIIPETQTFCTVPGLVSQSELGSDIGGSGQAMLDFLQFGPHIYQDKST